MQTVANPVPPVHFQSGGGVALPTCDRWPLSDIEALPRSVRVTVDTDANGFADHVATVDVRLLDDNGDGVFSRYSDRILLDPRSVEKIEPGVRLSFGEPAWAAVVKRAAAGL